MCIIRLTTRTFKRDFSFYFDEDVNFGDYRDTYGIWFLTKKIPLSLMDS
jgi:hypothetical protein